MGRPSQQRDLDGSLCKQPAAAPRLQPSSNGYIHSAPCSRCGQTTLASRHLLSMAAAAQAVRPATTTRLARE